MRISCVFNKRRSFALQLSSLVSDYQHNRQNCERWKILCNCVIDQWGEKRRLWSADLFLIFLNLGISVKIESSWMYTQWLGCSQTVSHPIFRDDASESLGVNLVHSPCTHGWQGWCLHNCPYVFLRHSQAGTDDVWYDPYVSWDSLKCQQYKTMYKRIVSSDELANCGKTAYRPNIWGLKTFVFSKTFVLPKAFGV